MNPSLAQQSAVPSGVIKPLYRGSSLHSCQVSIQRGFNNWRKIPGLVLHHRWYIHSEDPRKDPRKRPRKVPRKVPRMDPGKAEEPMKDPRMVSSKPLLTT